MFICIFLLIRPNRHRVLTILVQTDIKPPVTESVRFRHIREIPNRAIHLFSAYGTPSAIFPPTCLRKLPISANFLPKMVPRSYYKLKHNTHLLFFCPHVYRFCLFSTYIRSFSAYFPPHLLPIFRRSCLAGRCPFASVRFLVVPYRSTTRN